MHRGFDSGPVQLTQNGDLGVGFKLLWTEVFLSFVHLGVCWSDGATPYAFSRYEISD